MIMQLLYYMYMLLIITLLWVCLFTWCSLNVLVRCDESTHIESSCINCLCDTDWKKGHCKRVLSPPKPQLYHWIVCLALINSVMIFFNINIQPYGRYVTHCNSEECGKYLTVIINDIHSSSISNELSGSQQLGKVSRRSGSIPQCHSFLILQRDHVIGSEELNKCFIV